MLACLDETQRRNHTYLQIVKRTQDGHERFTFSADGTRLVSADGSVIKVWDVETGEELTSLDAGGVLIGAAFNANRDQITSTDTEGIVKIWDVSTGELRDTYDPLTDFDYTMLEATYNPEDQFWAITNAFGDIWFCDVENNKLVSLWPLSELLDGYPINDMEFYPGSNLFMIGTTKGVFFLKNYSVPDPLLKWDLPIIDESPTTEIAIASGLVASTDKTNVFISSFTKQERIATLNGHSGTITDIAFSPDSATLATASLDCSIRLWNWKAEE